MLKVGSIEMRDGEWIIKREYHEQGFIFKDEDAYINQKDKPCYVPELDDAVYIGNDFLELCNGQQDLADELFEFVNWQHPETLKDEWLDHDEWIFCEDCGNIVNYGDGFGYKSCPYCGRKVDEDNDETDRC